MFYSSAVVSCMCLCCMWEDKNAMPYSNADIIVPVWNSPFETRACLAAILESAPGARLIVVDNGSSRETERMLEEFSEPLGDNGLFVKSDRNLGLIRAINMGLALSDRAFAVLVRPHVLVSKGWLAPLLEAAQHGMATSSVATGASSGQPAVTETFDVTFSVLALSRELLRQIGSFDEGLDGGEWCLKDYVRRAWQQGYRTSLSLNSQVIAGAETVFGSGERLAELAKNSRQAYHQRWGEARCYAVYFGKQADPAQFEDAAGIMLAAARKGHHFHVFLHTKQYQQFVDAGWVSMHRSIECHRLSRMFSGKDLEKRYALLKASSPGLISVSGNETVLLPGETTAITFSEVQQ